MAEVLTRRMVELENELKASIRQREYFESLTEFVNSFKSRDEMQSFLDSFRKASVIRFREHKLWLILEKP